MWIRTAREWILLQRRVYQQDHQKGQEGAITQRPYARPACSVLNRLPVFGVFSQDACALRYTVAPNTLKVDSRSIVLRFTAFITLLRHRDCPTMSTVLRLRVGNADPSYAWSEGTMSLRQPHFAIFPGFTTSGRCFTCEGGARVLRPEQPPQRALSRNV